MPPSELMLTMRPLPCRFMRRAACWQQKKTALRLTEWMKSQSRSVMSSGSKRVKRGAVGSRPARRPARRRGGQGDAAADAFGAAGDEDGFAGKTGVGHEGGADPLVRSRRPRRLASLAREAGPGGPARTRGSAPPAFLNRGFAMDFDLLGVLAFAGGFGQAAGEVGPAPEYRGGGTQDTGDGADGAWVPVLAGDSGQGHGHHHDTPLHAFDGGEDAAAVPVGHVAQ